MARVLFFLFAILAKLSSADAAGGRLALLIGIEDYPPSIGVLSSNGGPKKNVDEVQQALARLGFDIETMNGSGRLQDVKAAIGQFLGRLEAQKPDLSFFYYAGHGAASPSQVNYIIPNDASLDNIAQNSVAIDDLILWLSQRSKDTKHVVVIDACRNELSLPDEPPGYKGFSPISAEKVPSNVLVAFATSAGKSAANSQKYVSALTSEILKEGVELNTAFLNIQDDLKTTTKGKQVPGYTNSIHDPVFLAGTLPTGPVGCCEPAGAKRLVFRGIDAIKVYRSHDPIDGLVEVRGPGSIIVPRSQNEVHFWRDHGILKWVIFQTDWGVGYVSRSDVDVEQR